MANETWPRTFCILRKTIFSKFLLIFLYLKSRGKKVHTTTLYRGSVLSFSGKFLTLTTEFLGRGSQNQPKVKNSNRYNSKPEIDFVAIPTAFRNVTGGLKKPRKIFRQGRRKGSNSKMCHAPKISNPNF